MRPKWFVRWLERWIDARIHQSFQRYQMAQEWHRYRYTCMQCHAPIAVNDYCDCCGWGSQSLPPITSSDDEHMMTFTGMMASCETSHMRPLDRYNMLKKAGKRPTQVLKSIGDNHRDL
jgi:hypothetical protein